MFSRNETRVPLTGAGCFLRAVDRETRTCNDAGHLSQLILRLGEPRDGDEFRKFFREVFRSVPHLSAPVRRPYGVGYPSYCLPRDETPRGNIIQVHDESVPSGKQIPDVIQDRLSTVLDHRQGQLMAVDLVNGPTGAHLALTWAHMLFDGFGVEVFVDRLAEAWKQWSSTGTLPESVFESSVPSPVKELAKEQSFGSRMRTAREWSHRMTTLTEDPPSSLSGPLESRKQDLDVTVTVYDQETTARISDRAEELGGYMRPMMFYLAASMRAHHALMKARGESVSCLLVPVAVNMREGQPDPVFDSQVSFLWFTAGPDRLESFPGLIDHLKEQRLQLIREGFHETTAVALEAVKYLPTRLYRRFIRNPFDGEMASFFFSYTGSFLPDVDEILGTDVELGAHAPGVPPSPGSGLVFSEHRDRLTATHVYQSGLFEDGERERLVDSLEEDLGAGESVGV